MVYQTELQNEAAPSQFLAVLKPRRTVTTWTLEAGSVYRASFSFGEVRQVTQNALSLVAGTSALLSAGQFYYDIDSKVLYVRMSDSSNPSTKFVVTTYEIYVSTFDAHHFRDPVDANSRVVYFEPLIRRSPVLNTSSTDSLYGFVPVQSSSIMISNVTQFLQNHVYDSSFNQASISMYHWLDNLEVGNVKLVFDGLMSNVAYEDDQVVIRCYDRVDLFKKEYRNSGVSFFSKTSFPNLDLNFNGRPIRQVYGVVDGFVPVNIDFNNTSGTITTSDNRDWVVLSGQSDLGSKTGTVSASPVSTTTRTYVNSTAGFRVGDSVWFDRAVGIDEYKILTVVNYVSNYVEHTALVSAMTSGDLLKRSFVGVVTLSQNNINYTALYGRDYIEATFADGTSGFSFTTTLEANLSMVSTLSPNDRLSARVYGKLNTVTLGGGAFGSNDSESGNLTHPIVIFYDLLKSSLSIPELEINLSSFIALQGTLTEAVGFAIPDQSTKNFPTFRELIGSLLQTVLLKIYLDDNRKWKISQVGPQGAVLKTIADDEILANSLSYDFEYNDVVSDAIVEYAFSEFSLQLGRIGVQVSTVSATSANALYLHGIQKQETFKSLHFKVADAQQLANRLSYILGDRKGTLEIRTKNRFFDSLLTDIVQLSRTRLPGYEFDLNTERTRNFTLVESNRSLRAVTLKLEDQKGIEDNQLSW